MQDWHAYLSLAIGYVFTLGLIRWVLLTKQRQPSATVAWILSIVLLPLVGGVLFLFFGINRVERRKAHKQAARRQVAAHGPSLHAHARGVEDRLNGEQRSLMTLARQACGTVPTAGNHVELLIDTNIAYRRIEEAFEAAKETINLEYYIWKADRAGLRMRDLLIERAKAGVEVRFLYDGLGSLGLSRKFLQPMRDAGIQIRTFIPGRNLRERWSINLRSHRKIIVLDGRTGFTGGMNIGDEYLGRNKRLGYWRDTHLALEGPTVLQLQQVFAEDWYYAAGEELTGSHWYPHPHKRGDVIAQVISGGPIDDMRAFHSLMFTAINEARKRVTLATSFFVPTDSLVTALETAALRGVEVRLMLAGRSAHPWTIWAGRSWYDEMLRAGVTIHEYRRGILHSKTLTVDGCWSLVGTPNFDARSLILNFEVGVALYDEGLAAELERHYRADLEHARLIRLDQWTRRPLRSVFVQNASRLFAPVM
jgi:cardiolipin synthase